jgi:hypothetical protein
MSAKNPNNIIKSKITPDIISFNFIKSPFVEIKGNSGKKYIVQFIDTTNNSVIYEVIIETGLVKVPPCIDLASYVKVLSVFLLTTKVPSAVELSTPLTSIGVPEAIP